MYQYFIKVVPTIYHPFGEEQINTNQYSVTDYKRELDGGWDERGKLPGASCPRPPPQALLRTDTHFSRGGLHTQGPACLQSPAPLIGFGESPMAGTLSASHH